MVRSRDNIFFVTLFFVFAFALSLFALAKNYVQAEHTTAPVRILAVTAQEDIPSISEHTFVPDYGVAHQAPGFDLDSDTSLQKFLHTDHPFDDKDYIPEDLIAIDSDFTANKASKFLLRAEADIQFADMARHFWHAFSGDRLFITSAYRSSGVQNYLLKQGCKLIKCAQAGTSEHQAGLALDLKVVAKGGRSYSLDLAYPNKYSTWLQDNAATFGFHNTYQKGVAIDGKMAEGRHRRYLGKQLATLLMENNQTFAEYYTMIVDNG